MKVFINYNYDKFASLLASVQGQLTIQTNEKVNDHIAEFVEAKDVVRTPFHLEVISDDEIPSYNCNE